MASIVALALLIPTSFPLTFSWRRAIPRKDARIDSSHPVSVPRLEAILTPDARIAHIGVAVGSIDEALPFFRDVLGLTPHPAETADGATIVSLSFGETEVELLEPASETSPIARFLARRGPGIHHICFRVPDLNAALERCRTAGYQLVDQAPRVGAGGRRIAFIHPKATAGILYELTGE